MCADGYGAREVAKALNHAKALKPRAQQGKPDGWSVSTIRAVLTQPLYRGEIVYGRTAKAYGRELGRAPNRERGQIAKPETTWIRRQDVSLRIVDPALAARVDKRLAARRTRYLAAAAKGDERAPQKASGKYLLSGGMLICPTCGGHFETRKYPWKPSKQTLPKAPAEVPYGEVYICSTRRRKPGVCSNTLALSIDEADDAVLTEIEGECSAPGTSKNCWRSWTAAT
jgi:hypothetical protein